MTSEAEHLGLNERREFAVRFALARHLDYGALPADDPDATIDVNSLRDMLFLQAKKSGDSRSDNTVVGSFAVGLVEGQLNPFLAQSGSISRTEINNRLRKAADSLSAIDCRQCASAGQPCSGSFKDNSLVSRSGLCLKELKDLVEALRGYAEGLYRQSLQRGSWSVQTIFSTRSTSSSSPSATVRIEDATQKLGSSASMQLVSHVVLHLNVRHFDWLWLCKLPYVLLHEFICHAFQGCLATSGRTNCDFKCSWSEGWMDAFSLDVAKRWLADKKNLNIPWPAARGIEAQRQWELAHHGRYKEGDDRGGVGTQDDRARGRAAFEAFQACQVRADNFDADDFVRFSIQLNALPVAHSLRRRIGDSIFIVMQESMGPRRQERAIAACSAFLISMDAERLLLELRSAITQ